MKHFLISMALRNKKMIGRYFNKKRKFKLVDKPSFLLRLSILLNEGYTFSDGIHLLLPHHMKEYEGILHDIDNHLRDGYGVSHILSHLGFSKSALLPVVIAEKDGQLDKALQGIAKRLSKSEEAKKKLRNLLAYPAVLFVFIFILLIGFRQYFLPNMEAFAMTRQESESELLSSLPSVVAKIPDVMIGTGLALVLIVLISSRIYKRLEPAGKIGFVNYIPIFKGFFFSWKTKTFSAELGSLLQSGLSMQKALGVLIEQTLDPILSEIAKNVHAHVIFGEPFHVTVRLTKGLTKELASFAKHGEDNGHLPKELLIYSEQLEERIDRGITKGLAILQPALFGLIAVCILAAYIALLLPVYNMIDKI